MRLMQALTPILLLGAGFIAGSALNASGPAPKSNVKTLLQAPLDKEFTPGREVLIDLVEIPPDMALDRHWHPGEEFHYYLEGDVEIRFEGEPPILGKPGTVGHVPFKKRHMAVAGGKGAKIVVFRVHTQGEPWRYLDSDSASGH